MKAIPMGLTQFSRYDLIIEHNLVSLIHTMYIVDYNEGTFHIFTPDLNYKLVMSFIFSLWIQWNESFP